MYEPWGLGVEGAGDLLVPGDVAGDEGIEDGGPVERDSFALKRVPLEVWEEETDLSSFAREDVTGEELVIVIDGILLSPSNPCESAELRELVGEDSGDCGGEDGAIVLGLL